MGIITVITVNKYLLVNAAGCDGRNEYLAHAVVILFELYDGDEEDDDTRRGLVSLLPPEAQLKLISRLSVSFHKIISCQAKFQQNTFRCSFSQFIYFFFITIC